MTRQEFANVIALPLYQARRYLPVEERTIGIPDYEMFAIVEGALNAETSETLPDRESSKSNSEVR